MKQLFGSDNIEQATYLEIEAGEYGFSGIDDLFRESPELFDRIATEYRQSHPDEYMI